MTGPEMLPAPPHSPLALDTSHSTVLRHPSTEMYLLIKRVTARALGLKIFFNSHQSTQALSPYFGYLIFPASLSWRMSF